MASTPGGSSGPNPSTNVPWRQRRWLLIAVFSFVALIAIGGSAFAFTRGAFAPGTTQHTPPANAQSSGATSSSSANNVTAQPALFDTSLDTGAAAAPTTAPTDVTLASMKVPPSCAGRYPPEAAKTILICKKHQWLYAYQKGKLVFNAPVETARPGLVTPDGITKIFYKGRNLTFTSPWPKGSPYYYFPTHINYALEFHGGGFFLHDAWWHYTFGPGSNLPHKLPNGKWETGSHGCIGMSIANAKWLYNWAPIGTIVIVSES